MLKIRKTVRTAHEILRTWQKVFFLFFIFVSIIFIYLILILFSLLKMRHRCFVPVVTGNAFSFSLLNRLLAVSLSYMTIIMLRYAPSISTSWRVFIIKGWILLNAFSASIDDHTNFIFQWVNIVCHTDCFVDIEKFLHPWDKFHLIIVYNPFNVLLVC